MTPFSLKVVEPCWPLILGMFGRLLGDVGLFLMPVRLGVSIDRVRIVWNMSLLCGAGSKWIDLLRLISVACLSQS